MFEAMSVLPVPICQFTSHRSSMELKKTLVCCVVLVWAQICVNIVLIKHALAAKPVQEQNYGLGHAHVRVQTFSLLTSLGTSENFTAQVANLSDESNLFRTQPKTIHSLCWSIGSVWIEYAEPGFKSRRQGSSSVKPYPLGDQLCRPLGVGERIPGSVKYIGNSRLSKPGLSLFSDENFVGDELYFEGSRLMYTFVFKSFGFTGGNSWSIYPGGNFTGESTCLDRRYDLSITMDDKVEYGIGSVELGCQHQTSYAESDDGPPPPALILYYNQMQGSGHYAKLETLQMYFEGVELRLPFSRSFHAYSIQGPAQAAQFLTPLMSMAAMEPEVLRLNSSSVYTETDLVDTYAHAHSHGQSPSHFDDRLELSWTIFSGINFDGHSKCLTSAKAVVGATNQFKELNNRHDIHLMIGSIRFGCDKKVNNAVDLSQMQNHGRRSKSVGDTGAILIISIVCQHILRLRL